MAKTKEDREFLLGKELRDEEALARLKQHRLQRYNFTLGLVSGLLASCVVIVMLFAFHPGSVSDTVINDIETSFQSAEDRLGADIEQVLEETAPEEIKSLLEGIGSKTGQPANNSRPLSCKASESDRFDCWPHHYMASETLCQARNCCWNPNPSTQGVPYCFYPDDYVSYTVTHVSDSVSPPGMSATLDRESVSPYPSDVLQLQLDVTYETYNRLHVKIFDPNNKRYEVPVNLTKNDFYRDRDYNVTLQNNPVGILVTRKSNGAVLFDSRNMAPLVFADQFLQIGTRLSSPNIYGLGEHRGSLRLETNWTRLTLWTRDQPPSKGGNLYGAHPFYLNLEEDGQAHGVFLLNSNAIEVVLQPYAEGQGALTYHVLGGVLDFYIFTGPSPVSVIEQYVGLIGKPTMPPFWALGFHLCRFGYMNSTELRRVIMRNRALAIPYDVQWNDIDYMHSYRDWTYDANTTYRDLRSIVDDLHDHDQRYVIIVDPGISTEQAPGTYPPFDQGKQMDVFIKNASGELLVGQASPGMTAFPDFFHPNAEEYWFNQMQAYHSKIPFDGLWADMNEPGNFVDGSVVGCTDGPLDNPPFTPPFINGGKLAIRTVCPSAQQAVSSHYNLHNMYGWSETKVTSAGLKRLLGKRSFVLSRSTFPSSGHYGSHWLGDNRSEWPDLYYSIPGILNFNLFGVPMVGADVCGFGGNTTRELCIRWMQLGAFYPFMRNHACIGTEPQDPAAFDSQAVSYMRTALETRYALLPYMYTRFYLSQATGNPVVRPLFALFDKTEAIDRQFMWGDELLVSPVLEEGATTVQAYFPEGVWYDLYGKRVNVTGGEYVELPAPLSTINVHVRGGSIIPVLPAALTTNAARKLPFNLIVAPDENSTADGLLFWDDGESLDSIEMNKFTCVEFMLKGSMLETNIIMANYPAGVANFMVLGISSRPRNVSLNGRSITYEYDAENEVLQVRTLGVDLRKRFTLWWS